MTHAAARSAPGRSGSGALVVLVACLTAACSGPPPRSYAEFMEDRFAREGVLARCDREVAADLNDIECANARRAEATVALRRERERRIEFERESERKLAELRAEIERREQAERAAAEAAARAAEAAYEALWGDVDPEARPSPEALDEFIRSGRLPAVPADAGSDDAPAASTTSAAGAASGTVPADDGRPDLPLHEQTD